MKSISILVLSLIFLSFNPPGKEAFFTLKKFEKKMTQVKPGLFACKYEATNLEYNEFLAALSKNGNGELQEKVRIHNENWASLRSAEFYQTYPSRAEYPVVNVKKEGAVLFCEWLTEYNAYPKRAFKKVRFRLPTEEEWLAAAKAGDEDAIFPWDGLTLRRPDGIFRAHFKFVPEFSQKRMADGKLEIGEIPEAVKEARKTRVSMPAPVESFFPNDFGIYNLSGNAAEMLAEPGRTKGGSWNSYGYYLRLDVEDEYAGFTESSPMIGFRYFMDVIEE